jgi:hypothetical protein
MPSFLTSCIGNPSDFPYLENRWFSAEYREDDNKKIAFTEGWLPSTFHLTVFER